MDLQHLHREAMQLHQAGRLLEAASVWEKLAQFHSQQHQLQEAVLAWQKAIELQPNQAVFWLGLANARLELGDLGRAEAFCRKAWELDPDNSRVCLLMGQFYRARHVARQAEIFYRRAIELEPELAAAHQNLAIILKEVGRLQESLHHYQIALRLAPETAGIYETFLFLANYLPDVTSDWLFERYQEYESRYLSKRHRLRTSFPASKERARRLKIGYVSPDLRQHPCAHFIRPLLKHHDRTAFEIFAYAEVPHEDAVSESLKPLCDHWLRTVGMNDEALASRIVRDQIDILVDVAGHTVNNRLSVFAHKPAPIQVTWPLGMGYTSGLSAMDYYLTDRYFVPKEAESFFTEQIYRLPGAPFTFQAPPDCPEVAPLPAQANGYLTFGCFCRPVRLNYRVLMAWSNLLREVPESRLLLNSRWFADPQTRLATLHRLHAHGIQPDRVVLRATQSQQETLEAYAEVDVALDPFPHNGGTTTIEALWMGVPVVTLRDRPPLGHFGVSFLSHVGLQDWIARSDGEYLEIARTKSSDCDALARLRQELRPLMATSALCDQRGFVRTVEAAYQDMWQRGGGPR